MRLISANSPRIGPPSLSDFDFSIGVSTATVETVPASIGNVTLMDTVSNDSTTALLNRDTQ